MVEYKTNKREEGALLPIIKDSKLGDLVDFIYSEDKEPPKKVSGFVVSLKRDGSIYFIGVSPLHPKDYDKAVGNELFEKVIENEPLELIANYIIKYRIL